MTRMDRYFGARILATLLKTVLVFVFLYVLVDLLITRQRVIDKYDVPWGIVGQYYLCHVPTFVLKFQTVALGLLIATLFVMGRAAQDSEITALLAGGVSMGRIARAPIALGLLLSLAIFSFENTVGVRFAAVAQQLDEEYFSRVMPHEGHGPSWTQLGEDDWSCHILQFNRQALTGTDVFIHSFHEGGMEEIRADRIYWDPERTQWMLEDGRWATIQREPSLKHVTRITQIPAPFDESPALLFALEESSDSKTAGALYADLQFAEAMGVPTTRAWVDFHTKFSRPALCFVIVWLAIPFALRVRRGGIFLSFGLSIALGLAYVTLYVIALGLGNIGLLPPPVAAWLANGVFWVGGVLAFRRICG